MKKIIFVFLIIMLSYIAFGTTTYDYYYQRFLPGDNGYLYLGSTAEEIPTIFSSTKTICYPPNTSVLPNGLHVVSEPYTDGTYFYIEGSFEPAGPDDNAKTFDYSQWKETVAYAITNISTSLYTEYWQIDDYADMPQSAKIGTLSVIESWSDDNWSNGYLFAEESWNNYSIPADIDVFKIVTPEKIELDPGVYCIETEVNNLSASFGLEINLYNADTFNDNTKMQFMTDTYEGYNNRYDDNGQLDNIGQRLYFNNDTRKTCYIEVKQRNSIPEIPNIEYKIRVLKARPVILVHGINAFPQNGTQTGTTFEYMRDYLGYFKEVAPCVCYDFPWDSSQSHSGKGFEKYVGNDKNDNDSLFKYIYEKYDLHNDYKANIILHSMGGFIVRYQLNYQSFAGMINQVIFLNSPQYGSDLGDFCWRYPEPNAVTTWLASKFDSSYWGTSKENMRHLCRGGDTIWEMHYNKKLNIDPSKVSCGTSKGALILLIDIMKFLDLKITPKEIFELDYFRNCYNKGLSDSDGIVPYTSQNMKSLNENIETVEIEKDHVHVQKLDLNNMDSCRLLYNLIKTRMNAQ